MSAPLLQILLLTASGAAAAQHLGPTVSTNPDKNVQLTFRPSIAVVIGIFSVMFSLTFLLLMYAKFCHSSRSNLLSTTGAFFVGIGETRHENGRFSGIDKAVIESLPFFRFSALKGTREGLECAVCLSRFVDSEMLRLLPRCKHAFHKDCIDRWLESHSSCPLCRTRFDADDIAFFKFSTSSRCFHSDQLRDITEQSGDSGLELYVERDHVEPEGSTSRKLTASFRWPFTAKSQPLHNYKHRIVVSDVMSRSRWSDFNSADLISLDSEMLRVMSNRRFEPGTSGNTSPAGVSRIKEEMGRKRRLESKAVQMQILAKNPEADYSTEHLTGDTTALISPAIRCMSDITEVARYRPSRNHGAKDDKVSLLWLPIAQRTVQLFAGKERRSLLRQPSSGDASENA